MPIPPGVRTEQILKAVRALLKYIEKQKAKSNELIEEDELIFLVRHPHRLLNDSILNHARRIG